MEGDREVKKLAYSVLLVVAVLMFAGCVSTPPVKGGGKQLPDWVVTPPGDTADTAYFVGSGSAADDAAARSAAASDLVSSVTRFLGVKVTSRTTVTARDTLKKFSSTLDRTIHESSNARLKDFRVVDTFSKKEKGIVNVYLLGAYNKKALLNERDRIQKLFAEQQEAVSGPEAEGGRLASEGRYYQSAVKYIEAAAAAAYAPVDNARIKYERNMDSARSVISKINLSSVRDNLQVYIKQPFGSPFQGQVTAEGKPLAGVPVTVVYRIMGKNGRKTVRSAVVSSDSKGIVSFTRPPAAFVGKGTLTMKLDFASLMKKLEDVSDSLYPAVESLDKTIQSKEIVYTYTVLSHAKEIPTGVLVIDEDNSGAYTGKMETASGILEVLSSKGFNLRSLPVTASLPGKADSSLVRFVKQKYGDSIRRLIYGTAGIVGFQEEKGMYMVKVSGDIKVVDLRTGSVLYTSGTRFKTAIGSNVTSAMSVAFKQFGKEVGTLAADTLP